MARRRPAQDLAVGALFALALVVLALGVMAVGGESGIFFAKTHYFVVFPSADGLVAGAPVRMSGVQIGTVSEVRLPKDPGQVGIRVQLAIEDDYTVRVREDSRAVLRILQILTGEKFVEIVPGSMDHPQLAANAQIAPLEELEFFERGEAIAESLGDITLALKNILGPLERGEGLIGQMIQDPEFGQEGLASLRGTLDNLSALTGDVRRGDGMVGRLIGDEELGSSLDQLGTAIDEFASLMAAVGRQEGALGQLLQKDGAAELAIRDLQQAAASLKRVGEGLDAGEGLLGRLLNDHEYSEGLAQDLAVTLTSLASIAEKIDRGEGTLGALVNDRQLYDGAEDVAAGVNDSKFARWLLRRYRKKGIKAGDKELEKSGSAMPQPDPGSENDGG